MQKIETMEWTQIQGLTNGQTYFIQASCDGYHNRKPLECSWVQDSAQPTDEKEGILAEGIKIKVTSNIWVKTSGLPAYINIEEVA